MNQRYVFLLILLFVLVFAIRFCSLGTNPPGFFRDEADKGYTTYTLIETGKDQRGTSWPIFVQALHVTTSSVYQYLDIPAVKAIGLNETAVRLPACLAGTFSVLVAAWLAGKWWGPIYGLWAGLFLALSPWSLLLSRWANQSILLTLWIPLGVLCLDQAWQKNIHSGNKDKRSLALAGRGGSRTAPTRTIPPELLRSHKKSYFWTAASVVFFLLALYTYAPARLFIPVFVFLLWVMYLIRTQLQSIFQQQDFFIASFFGILFLIGAIPLIQHHLFEQAESTARLSRIYIFDGRPFFAVLMEWISNYFLHLSPNFLFVHGDSNIRHHTQLFGQVHWYLFPLLFAGLVQAFRTRSREAVILLIWFFCFPISAACTRESIPHALRSIFAIPPIQLLSVYGLKTLWEHQDFFRERFSDNAVKCVKNIWLILLVVLPTLYLYDLFFQYPKSDEAAFAWEYGYRDAIDWWQDHHTDVDRTVVSGIAEYPYIFFLFYDHYPPQQWTETGQIENVLFLPTGQPVGAYNRMENETILFLARPNELPQYQPDKVILTPSRIAIWKWVELQ